MESGKTDTPGLRIAAAILFLSFTSLSFAISRQHLVKLDPSDAAALQNVLSGIAASFLFVLFVDGIQFMLSRLNRSRFERLFGRDAIEGRMKLVYPDFVLDTNVLSKIQGLDLQFIYVKDKTNFPRSHYVDLPRAVAANDIEGAVLLSGLLGEMTRRKVDYLTSDQKVVASPETSFVSFGLSSNDITFMYLQRDAFPLFEIGEDLDPGETGRVQYLRITDNGQVRELRSDARSQYGIILKYRPDPVRHPNRVWILCAGLGPIGTPAAALYLTRNWKELAGKAGRRDFIQVVKVQHYSYQEVEGVFLHVRRKRTVLRR